MGEFATFILALGTVAVEGAQGCGSVVSFGRAVRRMQFFGFAGL